MDLGLKGKVAVVCGASQGLGLAVAEELAEAGADLVLCARSEARLREVAEGLAAAHGVRVIPVAADLGEPEGVDRVIDGALAAFGRVDILVTNSGGPPAGPFELHTPEVWRDAVAGTFESVLNLTRRVLPGMKERGWGRILLVTSIAVKQPVDGLILSNSVRAAVTGFARTLANEVARFGVTVNCILPGYTRTSRLDQLAGTIASREGVTPEEVFGRWESQIPAGRLGEPSEFGALVAFLASERAAYINGTSIPVDGGWVRGLF